MTELLQPIKSTKTTCPYCGVGCGVVVRTQAGKIIEVKGDESHPANFGKLCSKGSKLAETAQANVYGQVRASEPLLRLQREQKVEAADWNTALDFTAREFARLIATYGPDSVGFYISGQLLTEDYYVFNKLVKGLIGTNNIDTNSRLCMSSAVSGYKRTLGADAPPCNYEDLELADCVFIAGSNMAYAHPVAFRRLETARAAMPGHKLIVVDPRTTDTALMADLHLKIQPGTDVMLFNAMLHVMMQNGWLDMAYINRHTDNFQAMAEGLKDYTPRLAASVCGVPEGDIIKAATWFAQGSRTLSLYCQGLNQATTGTDKNTALIALHLATGQIGKPGAGPFSLTGQPNAMGGREVGGMATLLPAHRELSNPQHVAETAAFWKVKQISSTPGASAVDMFDQLAQGKIKAVWVACTNPAHSLPNSGKVAQALQNAELVVVQDAYLTPATVQYADVIFPATTWGEKEGTVTNSERRISRVRPALAPYGHSKHDWQIVVEFAQRLEVELLKLGVESPRIGGTQVLETQCHGTNRLADHSGASSHSGASFNTPFLHYENPEDIFNEHRESTRGRDLDITGLSYQLLEEQGPQQWPLPEGAQQGRARLYEEGMYPTANGKAKFVFAPYEPVAEEADARFPWRLNTGRLRDQWHGASRTGTLAEFFSHESEPVFSLNPADFKRLKLQANSWVSVKSRRGTITLRAREDESVSRNQAVLPMHWGPEFFGGKGGVGGVNALTLDAVDPYSKQPELKHAAVNIQKVHLPWQLVIFVYSENWLSLWQQARSLYSEFDAALCVPIGREQPGVLFRAASVQAPDATVLKRLQALFQCEGPDVMTYSDPQSGFSRRIGIRLVEAVEADEGNQTSENLDGTERPENLSSLQRPASPPHRSSPQHHSGSPQALLTKVFLAGSIESEGWLRSHFDQRLDVLPLRSFLLAPASQPPGVQVQQVRMVCNCVGVSEQDISTMLAQEALANPELDELQLLESLKCSLKCGTQCGSCQPEIRKIIRAQASLATMPT